MSKPKIIAVVPTYNGSSYIKSCIDSLIAQTLPLNQIIVVDNASTDSTIKTLSSYGRKIHLMLNDTNLGVTGGRNAGMNYAQKNKPDYVLIFDHDMVADKNMVKELVATINNYPQAGIVTPKIYYWYDKTRIWSAGTGINLYTGQVLFRGGRDMHQYETECPVQVAPAVMLIKVEALSQIGDFDDRYFATFEDTDFCFRASKLGFATYYSPRAISWHKISPDTELEADRLLSRSYWVAKNRILFMKDFGKQFFIFLLFVPLFSIYYLRLALKHHRLHDWFSYLRGTYSGLIS